MVFLLFQLSSKTQDVTGVIAVLEEDDTIALTGTVDVKFVIDILDLIQRHAH